MKVKVKTEQELIDAGFKHDWGKLYLGDKRNPEASISVHTIHALGGKEVAVISTQHHESGKLEVKLNGRRWHLNVSFLTEPFKWPSPKKIPSLTVGGKKIDYLGEDGGFNFPCSLQYMDLKTAKRVAAWVLKQK
jgi:hypothetical protein